MQISPINSQYNYLNIQNQRKGRNSNRRNEMPAFRGKEPNKLVKGIANLFKNVYENETYQKGIKAFSNFDGSFTHLLAIESAILSSFYILCTLRNDKIDKDQKPQMVINDTLTLGFSTVGAYLTDGKINKAVAKKADKYLEEHKDFYLNLGKEMQKKENKNPMQDLLDKAEDTFKKTGDELEVGLLETENLMNKHLDNLVGKKAYQIKEDELKKVKSDVAEVIKNPNTKDVKKSVQGIVEKYYDLSLAQKEAAKFLGGVSKLKSLLVFGTTYRFVGPVIFTPIANKISAKFFPNKDDLEDMKAAK